MLHSVKGCSNCTTAWKMGSMWAMGAAHSAAGILGQVEPSCFNKSVMLVGFSCQSPGENRMKSHQSVMMNYLNGALDIIFLQFGTPSVCGSAVRMGHLSYKNPLFLQHIPMHSQHISPPWQHSGLVSQKLQSQWGHFLRDCQRDIHEVTWAALRLPESQE